MRLSPWKSAGNKRRRQYSRRDLRQHRNVLRLYRKKSTFVSSYTDYIINQNVIN